jgi:hypothetical protein
LQKTFIVLEVLAAILCTAFARPQDSTAMKSDEDAKHEVSFKNEIMPIVKRACLPCHAEDSFNPSELSLDSRDLLMNGGKHGSPVVPGNPEKSILYQKISPNPMFGDRMPLDPKKKRGTPSMKSLSEDEIKVIRAWIEQGAKDK